MAGLRKYRCNISGKYEEFAVLCDRLEKSERSVSSSPQADKSDEPGNACRTQQQNHFDLEPNTQQQIVEVERVEVERVEVETDSADSVITESRLSQLSAHSLIRRGLTKRSSTLATSGDIEVEDKQEAVEQFDDEEWLSNYESGVSSPSRCGYGHASRSTSISSSVIDMVSLHNSDVDSYSPATEVVVDLHVEVHPLTDEPLSGVVLRQHASGTEQLIQKIKYDYLMRLATNSPPEPSTQEWMAGSRSNFPDSQSQEISAANLESVLSQRLKRSHVAECEAEPLKKKTKSIEENVSAPSSVVQFDFEPHDAHMDVEDTSEEMETAALTPCIVRVRKLREVSAATMFVQPKLPELVPVIGMVTRETASNEYDDTDEQHNELIDMERGWVDASNGSMIQRAMPKIEKFAIFREACRISKLPAPLPFHTLESMDWSYVSAFATRDLAAGQQFLTSIELTVIPRRHGKFPFCHPGPVVDTVSGTRDWFYADSIVQEVELIKSKKSHFVVRWVGYEDEYNTVEPEKNLVGTAILILYKKKDHFIGAGASGPTVLRRFTRVIHIHWQLYWKYNSISLRMYFLNSSSTLPIFLWENVTSVHCLASNVPKICRNHAN